MYCKRIRTRRCSACKKVILIGESFERWSVGKARFVYCGSCARQGGGLTPRALDAADGAPANHVPNSIIIPAVESDTQPRQ